MDPVWQELQQPSADDLARKLEQAMFNERVRCAQVVRAEIEQGRQAGIPETSAAMRILARICSAIENG